MSDACRHCKGTSGFQTSIRYEAVRIYKWDLSEGEDCDHTMTSNRKPVCIDCGKPAGAAFRKLKKSRGA